MALSLSETMKLVVSWALNYKAPPKHNKHGKHSPAPSSSSSTSAATTTPATATATAAAHKRFSAALAVRWARYMTLGFAVIMLMPVLAHTSQSVLSAVRVCAYAPFMC